MSVTLQWNRPFFTLMGNFDGGPVSPNDIVSRKSHVSRNKKIKEVIKAVCICKSGGATHTTVSYSLTGCCCCCFGFNGFLRQYFGLYRAVSQREGERRERIDESKND